MQEFQWVALYLMSATLTVYFTRQEKRKMSYEVAALVLFPFYLWYLCAIMCIVFLVEHPYGRESYSRTIISDYNNEHKPISRAGHLRAHYDEAGFTSVPFLTMAGPFLIPVVILFLGYKALTTHSKPQ